MYNLGKQAESKQIGSIQGVYLVTQWFYSGLQCWCGFCSRMPGFIVDFVPECLGLWLQFFRRNYSIKMYSPG